jgi:hypothetical protein
MLYCCLLLYFGICQSVILQSKDVQNEISYQLLTPEDLLKVNLVDKSWTSVENVLKKIADGPGIEFCNN